MLGLLGAILVSAAVYAVWDWGRDRGEMRASAAVARVQNAYLAAMGASPGSFEVVEPANPETGRQVRREFVVQFLEVAEEHAGTASAVAARMEAAALQDQAGNPEAAGIVKGVQSARRASPIAHREEIVGHRDDACRRTGGPQCEGETNGTAGEGNEG